MKKEVGVFHICFCVLVEFFPNNVDYVLERLLLRAQVQVKSHAGCWGLGLEGKECGRFSGKIKREDIKTKTYDIEKFE